MQCFTCTTCRNRLVPGDRFRYVNGSIFCEHDHPGGELLGGHGGRMSEQKVRKSRSSRVEEQEGGGTGPTADVSAGLLRSFCCLWTIRRFLLLRTRKLVPAGLSRPLQTSRPSPDPHAPVELSSQTLDVDSFCVFVPLQDPVWCFCVKFSHFVFLFQFVRKHTHQTSALTFTPSPVFSPAN